MDMDNIENTGMYLLKKGQKGLKYALFSRVGIIMLLLCIQFLLLFGFLNWFSDFIFQLLGGIIVFIVIMIIHLLNSTLDPTAKITWLIVIMLFPVFGTLLFWYTESDLGHRIIKQRFHHLTTITQNSIVQSKEIRESLEQKSPGIASLVTYVNRSSCHPIFDKTDVTYFSSGEEKFAEMLIQLEQAQHFIFLEYFIIEEGLMWGTILNILARKASEGVEVRVMYDGTCEFSTLSYDYPERLKALGIQCKMFAPVTPFVSTHYNYRDHRKILVIDGHTAFNGGVNLADEYINHVKRFGHWKDTAVMLKGEAVKSFTLMFLQMWGIDEKSLHVEKYLSYDTNAKDHIKGYVMPYGDCPLDNDRVGERVYMNILNRSCKYVHIMSPYLILDGELEDAMKFTAERGVEVALILPGIPDKKAPYALAKTHFASLLESGVKIYIYTPGFVHAKVFVSDNQEAVVGTINLDYRSLYHHFECATYLYQVDCIAEIEADFQETAKKCCEVTKETLKHEKWFEKAMGQVLKAVAPLL